MSDENKMVRNQDDALDCMRVVVLDIATFIHGVCARHNIKYSLVFGSLLGAVRHRGFIPWDTDMDFAMPRQEYDKFLQVIESELPPFYALEHFSIGTSKRYIARIVDKRTLVRLGSYEQGNDMHFWLDVFPLDGVPDTLFAREIHYARIKWHKAMCAFAAFDETVNIHKPGRPPAQQLIINICAKTHFGKALNIEKELNRYDAALRRYPYSYGLDCICESGPSATRKKTWPRRPFEKLILYKFETALLWGPEDYDPMLTILYGDYMTPIEESKREKHQLQILEMPELSDE